jgi:hypothetical protein
MLLLALVASAKAQESARTDKVKIDDDQTYLVLSTKRIQTMEKELDEVAAKGFRVMFGGPTQAFDMALLLKRTPETVAAPYTYKILATSRIKTMQKELNELAGQGFRLLSRTIIFKQGLFTAELLMIMEREPQSTKTYEYKLLTGSKETKLHKKVDEAIKQGFVPVTMITIGEHIIVVEKEGKVGDKPSTTSESDAGAGHTPATPGG